MILMKDIVKEGHDTLSKVALDVDVPLSIEDSKTLKDIFGYLIMSQDVNLSKQYDLRPGVGLAAPQINISKRMFGVLTEDENGTPFNLLVVNPILTYKSDELVYLPDGEGCLSINREVKGLVPRHKKIRVSCYLYDIQSDKLNKKTFELSGYVAIVFQHEFDHINGIMFTDRIVDTPPKNSRPLE